MMTKHFNLALIMSFLILCGSSLIAYAETPRLIPNAPPLDRTRNFVVNGSFEEPHLENGSVPFGYFDTLDGDGYYFIIEASTIEPHAIPEGWTTSGGGPLTYARWANNQAPHPFNFDVPIGQAQSDPNIHGVRTVYMGNFFVESISETPQFLPTGEVVFTEPPIITIRPGYDRPVRVSQNIKDLIPGRTYRLSFWVSGENSGRTLNNERFPRHEGLFGFELEGYDTMYLAIPPGNAAEPVGFPHIFGSDPSHVYTVEFEAVDTEMDLTFINWGHFNNPAVSNIPTIGWTLPSTPEVVIDDVIINPIRNVPTLSEWGLILLVLMFGTIGLFVIRRKQAV